MDSQMLLDIVKDVPAQPFKDIGCMIPFGEILNACACKGLTNKEILESKLRDFEKQGKLKLVFHNTLGFEDLIIGVVIDDDF